MPRKPFEAVCILKLSLVVTHNRDYQDFEQFFSSFPNVKYLTFDIKSTVTISSSNDQLIISKESPTLLLLNELTVSESSILECFGSYNGLKCLNIKYFTRYKIPNQLFCEQLQQLAILRIPYESDVVLVDSLRKLPKLLCLEVVVRDDFSMPRGELFEEVSTFIFPGLVEFAVIVSVSESSCREKNMVESCASIGRLVSIVHPRRKTMANMYNSFSASPSTGVRN